MRYNFLTMERFIDVFGLKKSKKLPDDELYVMLMLMRASEGSEPAKADCEDPMIKAACLLDSDKCPAECKGSDEKEDNTVVKSGDLAVKANSNNGGVILAEGVSDMDTLVFKTSEEVEITKVVLERYGYSTSDNVVGLWLEDENGTIISNEVDSLNSKGQATLTLKKDYRNVDGTLNATVVIKAKADAGNTIGFKVVDVTSTAKNVDLGDYKPYTYSVVNYDGANVTLTARGSSKTYNWEAGKSYEVAKFKLKAPSDSAIEVRSFTLKDSFNNVIEYDDYLKDVTVTVAGKEVKSSYSVNKDDELIINLSNVELAAKDNAEFVVSIELSDGFDNMGKSVQFYIDQASDISATDAKTSSRVLVKNTEGASYKVAKDADGKITGWPTYVFEGGKVKLTSTKLGNVEASEDSTDIVIAEGEITTSQTIKAAKDTISVSITNTNNGNVVKAMRLEIGGDEYEGTKNPASGKITSFTFPSIDIDKTAKIRILVDTVESKTAEGFAEDATPSITFKLNGLENFKYEESKTKADFAGSLNISKLTLTASKASLTNSITKDVEFKKNEVTRKVVFEGTYSAKKQDLKLNEFIIEGNDFSSTNGTVTFYLIVDGDEVADAKLNAGVAKNTFTNVEIDAGKSVKLVVEAEVDAKNDYIGTIGKYKLTLKGEDSNGNKAGEATKNTTTLKVVDYGAVNVSTSATKNDILRKASNVTIAEFVVKPGNNASEVDLDQISFNLAGNYQNGSTTTAFTPNDVTVTIDGVSEDSISSSAFSYEPTTTVKSEGVTVKIELNEEPTGIVEVTGLTVNNKEQASKTFKKAFYPAVVKISKMEDLNGTTRYTLTVDKDDDVDVRNFKVLASGTEKGGYNGEFADGDRFSISGTKDVVTMLDGVTYEYSTDTVDNIPATEASCTNGTLNTEKTACLDTTFVPANTESETEASCTNGTLNAEKTACLETTFVPATEATTAPHYETVEVSKTDLADYFKIGSSEEDLKIFKL